MLKNIKVSFYFLNKLFSLINEEKKLKFVRYNKNLQSILNISLTNYKFFTGRFIIFESNGKGKEYNGNYYDELLFEGEYLNGKRNGKGKEYRNDRFRDECKLIFEGEYLNGKRHGKGKEYTKKVI